MLKSIFIESRAYFDKSGGNTYFSARISVNGTLVGVLPFQYGYGSQFETEALKWLEDNAFELESPRTLWSLRTSGVDVYTVQYWTNKTEAKRFVQNYTLEHRYTLKTYGLAKLV
jgi:hypothetical protein